MYNPFFKNTGPHDISILLKNIDLVDQYLKTVSKLPISIIEIGYLSDNYDLNGPFYHLNKKLNFQH